MLPRTLHLELGQTNSSIIALLLQVWLVACRHYRRDVNLVVSTHFGGILEARRSQLGLLDPNAVFLIRILLQLGEDRLPYTTKLGRELSSLRTGLAFEERGAGVVVGQRRFSSTVWLIWLGEVVDQDARFDGIGIAFVGHLNHKIVVPLGLIFSVPGRG